jgi:hypothetical protein
MSWNGDSSTFHYSIKATDKDLVETLIRLIRSQSPDALPSNKKLKIEEKVVGKKGLFYYELNFSYGYGPIDVFDITYLRVAFKNLVVTNKLLPFYTVRIEAVITISNLNEYTRNTTQDITYICSPAQYPKDTATS